MHPVRPTHADRVQTSGARSAVNTFVGRNFFFATADADADGDGNAGPRPCRHGRAPHHPLAAGDGRKR